MIDRASRAPAITPLRREPRFQGRPRLCRHRRSPELSDSGTPETRWGQTPKEAVSHLTLYLFLIITTCSRTFAVSPLSKSETSKKRCMYEYVWQHVIAV